MAKQLDFETALKKLEQIVHSLEGGDLELKEALQTFEEGVKLANVCNQELEAAEKKVEILLQQGNDKKKRAKFDHHKNNKL